jgi:hypothetical protein
MMDKLRLIPEYYKVWLLLFFLTQSSLVYSASSVGQVLFVHGTVHSIDQQGIQRLLAKDDAVFSGDRIITQAASSLQIQMIDEGYFAVRPSSEISIDEYVFENKATDSVKASIIRGGLRSITGAIGKKYQRNFAIKTPVATIGIRGTDMVSFYISPEEASPDLGETGTYVSVDSGAGFLETPTGQLLIEKGKAAYAAYNSKPVTILRLPGIFKKETFEKFFSNKAQAKENTQNDLTSRADNATDLSDQLSSDGKRRTDRTQRSSQGGSQRQNSVSSGGSTSGADLASGAASSASSSTGAVSNAITGAATAVGAATGTAGAAASATASNSSDNAQEKNHQAEERALQAEARLKEKEDAQRTEQKRKILRAQKRQEMEAQQAAQVSAQNQDKATHTQQKQLSSKQDSRSKGHIYITLGGGNDSHVATNFGPMQTSLPRFAPLYRSIRIDSKEDSYASAAFGAELTADLAENLEVYVKGGYQYRRPLDLDEYSLGIYDITLGTAIKIEDLMRIWLEVNQISADGDEIWNEYDSNRIALGAALNAGRLIGVFAEVSRSDLQYADIINYAPGYNSITQYDVEMDMAEAGIRINPVIIPLDIYVSAVAGYLSEDNNSLGSRADYGSQDLIGLRARAEFNKQGMFSVFGSAEAVRIEDIKTTDLEDDIVELKVGAEVNLTDNLSITGAVKRIGYWDNVLIQSYDAQSNQYISNQEEQSYKTTVTEFKVKLSF